MASWYLENGCIQLESLEPIWMTFLGYLLQAVWSGIMVMQTEPSSCPKLASFAKKAVTLYTTASIIFFLISDIVKIAIWMGEHNELAGGDYFYCIGCVLLTSPNYKSIFVTGVLTMFDDTPNDSLSKISVNIIIILFYIQCIWVFPLGFVGIVCLGWPLLIVVGILGVCAICWYVEKEHQEYSVLDGPGLSGLLYYNRMLQAHIFAWVWFYVIVGLFELVFSCYFGLGMVNFYKGKEYWKYGWEPFRERHWELYWNYTFANISNNIIGFLRWIGLLA